MTISMMTTMEQENAYTSGVYSKRPVTITRGRGTLVWDAEGREYLDCIAGHGVANIGHGRAELATALAEQAQRLITCPESLYNDVRASLLERLVRLLPTGLEHLFLCNSGTEAVEGAFKFARLATGRTGIVAALRGFHGRSMGSLAATWEPHYREPFAPLLPGVSHVRFNDLAAAEGAIQDDTAAVIIELVQGEGGVHVATEAYVRGLADLCRERGALLIIDEVQTGFGRTGRFFACEHYDLQPDILCMAKALGGGVPIGAIALGPRVIESGHIFRGAHGSTFGGNPLACAAALTTLDILEREDLPQQADRAGATIRARLQALHLPVVREVRGLGLLIGIELRQRVQPYLERLTEHGVLVLPAGPNVLRLLPPLVITDEQIEHLLTVLAEVLSMPMQGPARATNARNASAPRSNGTGDTTSSIAAAPTSLEQAETLLADMLRIASYSGEEGALARFLVGQARRMGLYAWIDAVGNFVASTHPENSTLEQPIVLLGHMDTVRGEIPVRIENGLLYGRGAVDAKGPLAAFVCAAARMRESLQAPLVVIGAVEEESATSRGARAVVERYRPSACIIGEPSGSEAVTIGYKGRLLVDSIVRRSSSHSAGPAQSSSEVAAAFWERVRCHAETWNQQFAPVSAFAALQPSLRTIISEQDGLEDRTHLVIGYRLPVNFDSAALRTQLENWASEAELEITFAGEESAFQTNRTIPLAWAFIAALRATNVQPTFKYKTGTSDMNVVGPVWGQNIVAYGPGDSGLDHTPDEHIRLEEYHHAIEVLSLVVTTLAQQRERIV
jgi:predicted acetylornithine/succinylornithine family transaminase/N-acetyl-ornithine/N-acetyl-lysine deacetylase